jgi:hypothetical protein
MRWDDPTRHADGQGDGAGGVAYAVQTAVNGGSELLIFVLRAAHSQITLNDLGDDDIDE